MIALLAAAALAATPAKGPVLIDARCPDAEWRGASATDLGEGVTLLAQHDRDQVYLCFRLPPESLGTLDMYLQDSAGQRHNLHISAQVGERTWANGAWPDWTFDNHQGWFGPPVPFSGLDTRDPARPRINFRDGSARELAMTKARFGRGPWMVMMQVRALGADRRGSATFPAAGDPDRPETWTRFSLSGR